MAAWASAGTGRRVLRWGFCLLVAEVRDGSPSQAQLVLQIVAPGQGGGCHTQVLLFFWFLPPCLEI